MSVKDHVVESITDVLRFIFKVLLAVLIGRAIGEPFIQLMAKSRFFYDLVLGGILFLVVVVIIRAIYIVRCNVRSYAAAINSLPKNVKDLRDMGICNPVDFCLAMELMFKYESFSITAPFISTLSKITNEKALTDIIELFKIQFHRDPLGFTRVDYCDWKSFAEHEARAALNLNRDSKISSVEIWRCLSPEFVNCFNLSYSEDKS